PRIPPHSSASSRRGRSVRNTCGASRAPALTGGDHDRQTGLDHAGGEGHGSERPVLPRCARRSPRVPDATLSQLDAGNIQLGLHPESDHLKASPSEGCSFGFYVDNIQKIVAELKAKAVKVLQEPQKEQFGWLALVADPDGYVVQLFQTGAQAQTG